MSSTPLPPAAQAPTTRGPAVNRVRIEGDLIEHAQPMVYTDGTAVALLRIGQPGADPIVVERCFGNSDSARFLCAKVAAQLRKGCHVTAHGVRLRAGRLLGATVIRLEGVDHVEHHGHPTHFNEPAVAAA
jgi:hypothetical protein